MPQGVKSNALGNNKNQGFTHMSPNLSQGQYQNFNTAAQYSNPNSNNSSHTLNNSASSAYRNNQVPQGGFGQQPKVVPSLNSKNIAGLTSPTGAMHNQGRSNIPVYNAYGPNHQSSGSQQTGTTGFTHSQWQKH